MIAEPFVSVLMPAYNREQYIAEAIESVLASSYSNFELIIVDDQSTDGTYAIASSYAKLDQRVRLYQNEVNLKQFGNRNKAASYATGKYIKYADSDDLIYKHTLKVMVDIMESFPEAGLGFCHSSGDSDHPLPHQFSPVESYRKHYFGGGLLYSGPSGMIFKNNVFNDVGGFEMFGMPSDNHLTLKIAARFPVVAMYRDLFWWRRHDEQAYAAGIIDYKNVIDHYNYNYDLLSKESVPLDPDDKKRTIESIEKNFSRNILTALFKKPHHFSMINKVLLQSKRSWWKIISNAV